jgi:DNA-binding NtrC family response regulator
MEFYKNYTQVAKALWISRPTLMKRIKDWEIKINKIKKEYKYFLTN